MRVGLFDSGVGGLTVLRKLIKKYPCNEYVYYGDTLNMPYGDKSKEELLTLAKHNIEFLLSKNVEMIIVACGTVSSNCLNELKIIYKVPIISIIEPTIEYLNTHNYKSIGLMATKATIDSHIFKNNLDTLVYEIATPKLVPLIENNNLKDIDRVLHEYLDEYKNKIDVLVLGCTHYPIIRRYIEEVIGNIDILDMSDLIDIDNDGENSVIIYFSKINDTIINNVNKIIEVDASSIKPID